ncbi:MAG TPA: SBBP repeat-containing protein [Bacteroidia bacterium]|nr:SBBP repeat-containing protein [Bacteroidia bacterium]
MRKLYILISLLAFNYSFTIAQKAIPQLHSDQLEFIPNKGQIADTKGQPRKDILFTANTGSAQVYLRNNGISYVVSQAPPRKKGKPNENTPDDRIVTHCRLDMDFAGASTPTTETTSPTDGLLNYYLPQCPTGVTGVQAFNNVKYKNIYPNIDVAFKGTFTKGLEYDVIVNPGGNVASIKMHYTGAEKIDITSGSIKITTPLGNVSEYIPSIYQEINGTKVKIEGSYTLLAEDNTGREATIGFDIKNYNKSLPLIIDPWWSTYLGGNLGDDPYASAFDNAGNLFVAGESESNNFPTTVGVFQSVYAGGQDAFVIKFTPAGARIWATYYGGSGEDGARGIAVDAGDNTYVGGITNSTNFPTSAGAFQTTLLATGFAAYNAFLFRLNSTGLRVFGTYYGGDGTTQSFGVTADGAGNGIMVGYTSSSNLPVSAGAFQAASGGVYDAFCTEFSPAGAQLWGTYMGGSADDRAFGVTTDKANNVFVGGNSTSSNFPVSVGCYQPVFAGGGSYGDAFVFKFDNTGARIWATYLGGTGDDGAHGIAIDGNSDVVVAGLTLSSNFPVTAGAFQTTNTMILYSPPARADFVTKLTNAGAMVWSTYFNVATEEGTMSIDVDQYNRIYTVDDMEVSSSTKVVPDPVLGCAFDNAFNNTPDPAGNPEDQFIAKFNPAGFPVCETFVGGSGEDDHELWTKYMTVQGCQMSVAGFTDGNYPVSSGAFQATMPNPYQTGFVTDLSIFQCGDTNHTLSFTDSLIGSGCSSTLSCKAYICDSTDTVGITFSWAFPGGTPSSATGQSVSGIAYATTGTYPVTVKILGGCTLGVLDSVTRNVNVTASTVTLKASKDTICAGSTTTITATGGGTYAWSTGATTSAINITPANTTTYSVVITNGSCKDSTSITIKVNPLPIPGISGTPTICSGSSAILTATGGTNYIWSTGATTSNITVTPATNTTYTVQVANGTCVKDTTFSITVNPSPTVTVSGNMDTICKGSTITITAAGGGTYLWSNGATTATISVSPGSTSNYVVVATNAGCKDSTTVLVTVDSLPKPIISGPRTICLGNPVTLSASGGSTYIWSTGATTSNIIINPATITSYTLTAFNGLCSAKDSTTISIAPGATGIACCDTTIKFGGSASLTVASAGSGSTYTWTPSAGLSCTNCINPSANPTTTTKYYVIITDSNGCAKIDSVLVTVLPEDCGEVFVPNAFSPNGDNENDILFVYGNCINTMLFQVFDRWGNKVFESTNRSSGWDGKYNGVLMNTGVYVYKLQAIMLDNTTVSKKGNITLMR